jgi:hypothetical protein
VDVQSPIKSRVEMDRSVWNNPITAALTALVLLVQFILCLVSMSSLPSLSECVGADVWAAQKEKLQKELGAFLMDGAQTITENIELHPSSIAIVICMVLGCSILLVVCFRMIPKQTTWILAGLNIILITAVGIWLVKEGASDPAIACFVIAAICAVWLFVKRSAVDEAANLFKMCTYAITANPSMIGGAVFLQIVSLALGALYIAGILSSVIAGTFTKSKPVAGSVPLGVVYTDAGVQYVCAYERASWGQNVYYFLSFCFTLAMFNIKMVRLYMVSVVTGLWWWETDSTPAEHKRYKACKGLKWVFTTGFGVVGTAAIIITVVDKIVKSLTNKSSQCANCCNPIFWIFYFLLQVFKEMMYALTTFSMITAALTAEGYWVSVNRCYYTLKGRFTTLFTVSAVSRSVVFGYANIVAFLIYCAIFEALAQKIVNCGLSGTVKCTFGGTLSDSQGAQKAFQYVFVFVGLLSTAYPIVTVCTCLFAAKVFTTFQVGPAWLLAIFLSAIGGYLLTFVAEVFLDVQNSLFCIAEIDRRNGVVPTTGAKEGTPAYFAGFYYTEMAKQPSTGQEVAVVQTAVVVQQGQVVQGTPINSGGAPPPYQQV